ncbi:FAD/NAD(P)-binding protein, partial [Corynebacterium nasicanis]
MPRPAIAVVGLGPRGISVVERLAAALEPGTDLTLHLIDDAAHGAGRVWDTTQTRTLCMNTLSAAVTLFTEPGASVTAPVLEGPILHEWIQHLRGEDISPAHAALLAAHPPRPEVAEAFAAEIAETRPESHPSRALYGAYLRWVFDVALARLPESVTVVAHHAR